MLHAICLGIKTPVGDDAAPSAADVVVSILPYDGTHSGIARCSICGACWAYQDTSGLDRPLEFELTLDAVDGEYAFRPITSAEFDALRPALAAEVPPGVGREVDHSSAYASNDPRTAAWKSFANDFVDALWARDKSYTRRVIVHRWTLALRSVAVVV